MIREVGRKPVSSGFQKEGVAYIGRPQKEKRLLDLSVRRSLVTLSISVAWLKLGGVKE